MNIQGEMMNDAMDAMHLFKKIPGWTGYSPIVLPAADIYFPIFVVSPSWRCAVAEKHKISRLTGFCASLKLPVQ